MNILHIDSSPRGEALHSRKMTAELVIALQKTHPSATVTYRDLGHQPPPLVTEDWQNGDYSPEEQRTPAQAAALEYSDAAIDELLAADIVVIGAPMYNFAISADFKAWLDQVIRINKTFLADYTGLAAGKKVFVVTSRGGGGYGAGEAMEKLNFQDPYLRTAFGFIGGDFLPQAYPSTAQLPEVFREFSSTAGDPVKAVRLIIEAVEAENPPFRLPLGLPAFEAIEAKLEGVKQEISVWRERATQMNFDVAAAA